MVDVLTAKIGIKFKTRMLRSDLPGYDKAYIVVKVTLSVEDTNANNQANDKLAFKNDAPFRSSISIVMLMRYLLEMT